MPAAGMKKESGERTENVTFCTFFLFGRFWVAIPVECLPERIITFFANVTKVPKRLHLVGGGSRKSASNNT